MKISKQLEKRIDKELAEYEKGEKEHKVEFYNEEQAIKYMFGESYINRTI